MNEKFLDALRTAVANLPPDFLREEGRQIDIIGQAGIGDLDDLMMAVENSATATAVRIAGSGLLGRLGDPRCVPLLLRTFAQTQDVQLAWEVARALSLLRTAVPAEHLASFLGGEPNKATAAAWAMGRVSDSRASFALRETLRNKDREIQVRAHAAESLGVLRARDAVTDLVEALHDDSAELRYWGAYALGEIGDPSALAELRRLADSDDAVVPGWGSVAEEARASIEAIVGQPR
jgi:HEAT repeat protein